MASATLALQAMPVAPVAPIAPVAPDSFRIEELYELQKRQGKMKPPVITYEQLNSLKRKLDRSEGLDCALVRMINHAFQDFGSLSSWLLWNPFDGCTSGFERMRYSLFGSSRVDNIVSGRARMARLRPSHGKNSRDMLQVEQDYDPYSNYTR